MHAVIRQEDILLSLTRLPGSARNASADEMALWPGLRVMLAFKATAIHLV